MLITRNKWMHSIDYSKRFGKTWYKVFEPETVSWPLPQTTGNLKLNLIKMLDTKWPEAGVLEIDDPLVFGESGWLFSKEGYFLPELSWFGSHVHEIKNLPLFCARGQRLMGTTVTLATDFGNVFGHFLLDCLPRLELFEQAGFNFDEVNHILLPQPNFINSFRLLKDLKIPLEKCIWLNRRTRLCPQRLLAPSFPGRRRSYPSWVVQYLQRRLIHNKKKPFRKLYVVRRASARNILNERDVADVMKEFGFELYNPVEYDRFFLDFSEAAVVVGAHGSGLAGLAFCQPGTKVLEFIPSDHVFPYYYTLAHAAKLDYRYLGCWSTNHRPAGAWGGSPFDFHVDLNELREALSTILSN